MKITLRYSHIFFWIIFIIVVCDNNGFRLFRIEDNDYKAVSLIMVGIALIICIAQKGILNFDKNSKKFVVLYLGVIVCFLIFEYFYIKHMYGGQQTFYEFANRNKHYVFILLTIPLIYIFIIEDSEKKVMDSVLALVTITLGLMLLYAFFYNWREIELFDISMYSKTSMRNDRMRMWDLSSLEGLAVIYGTYKILENHKKRVLYLFQVIVCIATLIYVEQTKMMLIAIAISIGFMLLIKPYKTVNGILAKYVALILAGIAACSFVLPRLMSSLSKGASVSYRLIEIQFVRGILHNYKLFGMGMITPRLQKKLFYYGIYSYISLDDIGVIGYTAQAGIWIIGVYFLPMLRMAWILFYGHKNDLRIFLWTVYIYLLVTSATLLVLDSQRILMLPFCLALFEFYHKKYGII